ncbi:MAG: DNA primase, partial [Veillonella sp.]|nr:DNA primase [Veillonella sp.]
IKHDTNDAEGKQAVMQDIFPFIANIHSLTVRDDALKALALPLWLDNSTIFRYFRNYTQKGNIELVDEKITQPKKIVSGDEELLMAHVITDSKALQEVVQYLPLEDFQNIQYRGIIEKIYTLFTQTGQYQPESVEDVLTPQEYEIFSRLMIIEANEAVPVLIRKIRLHSLREQYKMHSILADQLKRAGDSAFISELHKCQEIQNLIREWSK